MAGIILAINSGSSSLKLLVAAVPDRGIEPTETACVQIGITDPSPKLTYMRTGKLICADQAVSKDLQGQVSRAFQYVVDLLINDPDLPVLNQRSDVSLLCHRVVHGGDYRQAQLITQDTSQAIEALADLAPLHNAPALDIIRSCAETFPHARNVAIFDTQFHQTIPECHWAYPINRDIARQKGLRKYGFHGISYAFMTRNVACFLGKAESETNLILLHLGSGASVCAVKSGQSWDTTMGLTPLAGLPGATRSGDLDPSLVFHYATDDKVARLASSSTKSLHITRAEQILNQESGWKSMTGSSDFAAIASSDDPKMKLAFDLFVNRICNFVGAYYVALQGNVDALVFAGRIGEKSAVLRQKVLMNVGCLGFEVDDCFNGKDIESVVKEIGKVDAKHRALVCLTDEQSEMVRVSRHFLDEA